MGRKIALREDFDGLGLRRLAKASKDAGEYLLGYVGEITHQFSAMAGARGDKDKADPYVVALAAHSQRISNVEWVVIADETLASRPNRKIPTACAAYGVTSRTLVEMLKIEFPQDDWGI